MSGSVGTGSRGSTLWLLEQAGGQFLDQLGSDHRSQSLGVSHGVELDKIGADDGSGKLLQDVERLSCAETARLRVGYPRGKGGVQAVQIDGDIERCP